jgi:hypothetical protein
MAPATEQPMVAKEVKMLMTLWKSQFQEAEWSQEETFHPKLWMMSSLPCVGLRGSPAIAKHRKWSKWHGKEVMCEHEGCVNQTMSHELGKWRRSKKCETPLNTQQITSHTQTNKQKKYCICVVCDFGDAHHVD